ncbi:hypothetical protein VTK56DRAFT_7486 [Thermocarpiscus australiensis]
MERARKRRLELQYCETGQTGPTEEEKLAEKKDDARRNLARFVEYGYQANTLYKSYFDLSTEQIQELGLEDDPFAHIHIPEIEPRAVRKAWKTYEKKKRQYLSNVDKGDAASSGAQASTE